MKAIQLISQDLFDKIRSRFTNLEMGDEAGAVTIDPAEARFFDFNFMHENVNLGRVSISLNDLGALKIYYSQGITENQEDPAKKLWYNFLKEMRQFAMRRLLRFDTRDIAKTNLDRNDFQYLASKNSKDEETMKMNESRWTGKSSKKTSRAIKGTTEVIVRHFKPVDEMYAGSRSQRKNIKAIYIQNKDGERFKYPFIHPAGAFAMAQHVDHGGIPHDPAGKAIIKMSEQIAQLQEFQRHVQNASLHDDAMGIRERAVGHLQELKGKVEALASRRHYESWVAEFNETEHNDDMLSELDPVTFEDYKSKFTQNSFKEELTQFFPLLHSIMQEKIDLEQYVKEEIGYDEITPKSASYILRKMEQGVPMSSILDDFPELGRRMEIIAGELGLHPDDDVEDIEASLYHELEDLAASGEDDGWDAGQDTEKHSFEDFEAWTEAVAPGNFDRSALDDKLQGTSLTDKLSSISLGPDGTVAWNEFSELFGFDERDSDDAALKDQLASKSKTADIEATGMNSPAIDVFKSWIEDTFPQWKEELPELFQSDQTNMTPSPDTGMQPAPAPQPGVNPNPTPSPEMGMNPAPKPVAEDKNSSMIKLIAERVKSLYNKDNENGGPWPKGEEGVLIDVEKTISEKFGEDAAKHARMVAEKFIEKLTSKWHETHKAPITGERSELDRLKELVGNIKQKVESISGVAQEEKHRDSTGSVPEMADIKKLAGLK